ncbi:MAG TPA: nucleotidyltransferase [Steroidobacteraceae bacterium]|nr:nucleotidyltransferase [Steroidobacteraceae bacterium]
MPPSDEREGELDDLAQGFYLRTVSLLLDAGIPFLVGGAYALKYYTGIERHTKDLDVFVRREHYGDVTKVLGDAGIETELAFPHWLGKASCEHGSIDVIFSSGNGLSQVDDAWFDHAAAGSVLGVDVRLCPPEEMIWSKAFITERERYDGADIMHLLLALAERLDWRRLLLRFDAHWRILLTYLNLFGFVYPSERARVPAWVMTDLIERLKRELRAPPPARRVCQGTLLSREQYLTDVGMWGFEDARVTVAGSMTVDEVAHWTRAISPEGK